MAETVEDYAAKQAAEYGQYVANGPIYLNGALAYNTNHPVPASNVETYKYLENGLVRRVGEELPEPPAQPELVVGEPILIDPASTATLEDHAEQHDPSAEPIGDHNTEDED